MPEWPEMETYRRLLNDRLCGRKIVRATVNRAKSINEPEDAFVAGVTGTRILFVERRGKQLVFHLDDGNRLLLHLMLGGWLACGPEGPKEDDAFQIILEFDDGDHLYFGGLRLGHLHRMSAKQANEELKPLGPDPFDPRLTPDAFRSRLAARRGKLKSVLTDQKLVSGIGNCYSDEICFDAFVYPGTAVPSLDGETVERLYGSMKKVLAEAASYGGYMDKPLTPNDRLTGGYDSRCRVYDREGEPCVRCGTPIVKEELAGRKMFYCPHCQKAE
ncbi:Fpg/Nei family DNA glycosylase [Cohnella caldifontis]|uniref:Fpg/Nei family DNA glycosylase n=1 Tax=Cohnella caldifontis TaxID=3027471 RepID=UPI0023EDEEA6|nr:DNA-formamidopyrimidine glycosylase family protein [Cohnella sp. YIM B05605]